MRTIKFRAWEKSSNEMIYDVQNVSRKRIIGESACESFQEVLDSWEYEVMQFTGFYDKNGVPIYEGDILNNSEIYWSQDFGMFAIKEDKLEMIMNIAQKYEIQGNIYENPELLETEVSK